ncbi:MAG: DUF2249 domain-containing protein [Planctomycetota bacterium]
MEIDIRQVPEGDRLGKVLAAVTDLAFGAVLTLITAEDPQGIADDIAKTFGDDVDIQRLRWGGKEITWRLHVKKSRMPSAYHPED